MIVDYTTLVALCSKELLIEYGRTDAEDEFMLRIILSCRNIERFIRERESDRAALSSADFEYIEAEQSLLLGHLTHPTPKSRQGMTEEEEAIYSPELKGSSSFITLKHIRQLCFRILQFHSLRQASCLRSSCARCQKKRETDDVNRRRSICPDSDSSAASPSGDGESVRQALYRGRKAGVFRAARV